MAADLRARVVGGSEPAPSKRVAVPSSEMEASQTDRLPTEEDRHGQVYRTGRAHGKLHDGRGGAIGPATDVAGGGDEWPGAGGGDSVHPGTTARVSGGGDAERLVVRVAEAACGGGGGDAAGQAPGAEGRSAGRVGAGGGAAHRCAADRGLQGAAAHEWAARRGARVHHVDGGSGAGEEPHQGAVSVARGGDGPADLSRGAAGWLGAQAAREPSSAGRDAG